MTRCTDGADRLIGGIRRTILILLGVVTSTAARCGGPDVVQSSKLAAQAFTESFPKPRPPEASDASEGTPRLFIDASRSMAGFAGCNASSTEYDTAVDRLTTDWGITSVVRFGQPRAGSPTVFEELALSRAVHCPVFYDRMQNPDYALYRSIALDTLRTAFVYLTDGVQSDVTGTNQSPSVDALTQWVSGGHGLAILAFRSEFHGPAWSEARQRMLGGVAVAARPFYAFLLTRSPSEIDRLLTRLSPATLAMATVISLAPSAVKCSANAAKRLPKYSSSSSPSWAMLAKNTFREKVDRTLVVAELVCLIDDRYPVGTVLPRVSMQYRPWTGTAWDSAQGPMHNVRVTTNSVSEGSSSVQVAAVLPFDQGARYGFYEMSLESQPGNLRSSVDSLSSDSDGESTQFNRTYRFSWLVEQLARAHMARWVGATPFTFTVQYR